MNRLTLRKLLGVSLVILILLLFFTYYKLGGLNPVQVTLIKTNNYHLLGRSFEGNYQSDSIRLFFNEMADYVKNGDIEGNPAIIYEQEPQGYQRISKCFIAVSTAHPMSYGDLMFKEIEASRAIRVSKDAHSSVMPNTKKVQQLIEQYAEEHNLNIGNYNIEIYHPNNRLVIDRPVN